MRASSLEDRTCRKFLSRMFVEVMLSARIGDDSNDYRKRTKLYRI